MYLLHPLVFITIYVINFWYVFSAQTFWVFANNKLVSLGNAPTEFYFVRICYERRPCTKYLFFKQCDTSVFTASS